MAKKTHIVQVKKDSNTIINSTEDVSMIEQKIVDKMSAERKDNPGLKEQLCANVPSSYLRRARRLK